MSPGYANRVPRRTMAGIRSVAVPACALGVAVERPEGGADGQTDHGAGSQDRLTGVGCPHYVNQISLCAIELCILAY